MEIQERSTIGEGDSLPLRFGRISALLPELGEGVNRSSRFRF